MEEKGGSCGDITRVGLPVLEGSLSHGWKKTETMVFRADTGDDDGGTSRREGDSVGGLVRLEPGHGEIFSRRSIHAGLSL